MQVYCVFDMLFFYSAPIFSSFLASSLLFGTCPFLPLSLLFIFSLLAVYFCGVIVHSFLSSAHRCVAYHVPTLSLGFSSL
mmetsp:Transcript_11843/g.16061  ORF Transcript_11843/g.16061 Transcript_11843/m.16061 type:complete len:80 (-) Transcript_11843:191-430(-)